MSEAADMLRSRQSIRSLQQTLSQWIRVAVKIRPIPDEVASLNIVRLSGIIDVPTTLLVFCVRFLDG